MLTECQRQRHHRLESVKRVRSRTPRTIRSTPLSGAVRQKGSTTGKLAGKRVGLKDNTCVAGVPMTLGSRVLVDYVPDADATIVKRILDAGAEIVAMLNMDSFALGLTGETSAYGATRNPHNREHLAGGSSSGSAAALYYDDIDLAMGADQGGSIRVPSAWCGVVGLKPTFGLVPYTGIFGMDPTTDHAGPMGRTVEDVALLLEVVAGKDPDDPRQQDVPIRPYTRALGEDVNGLRLGVLREGFGEGTEPDVEAAVRRAVSAFTNLGADAREVSVPVHGEATSLIWTIQTEGMTALFHGNGLGHHWKGLYNEGLAAAFGKALRSRGDEFPPAIKLVLLLGDHFNHEYYGRPYSRAQNQRPAFHAAYDKVLEEVDVLVMPTTPAQAFRHDPALSFVDHTGRTSGLLGNTAPFNLTGHPSLSVPCAKANGLPVGMLLTGRHFEESTLFRVAYAFEQSVTWDQQ